MRNKKTLLIIFAALIGVACLSRVLLDYQWRAIEQALAKSDFLLFFAGSIISIIFYWFFRALRWQILLRAENLSLPLRQIYLITAVSVGLSTVTPFQSGEALKVEYLRKHGGARLSGYAIFFFERVFDLSAVVGLGILGVSFGFDSGVPQIYFYAFAIILVAAFSAIIGIVFLLPSERLNPVRDLLREKRRQKPALAAAVFLTVLSWLMVVLGWKIALNSVSIDIGFLQASSVVSLTTLLAIMSFVPGAVGVSEISITAILTKMQVAASLAQTGAIAVRAYTLTILALTFLHWIILKYVSKKLATGVTK